VPPLRFAELCDFELQERKKVASGNGREIVRRVRWKTPAKNTQPKPRCAASAANASGRTFSATSRPRRIPRAVHLAHSSRAQLPTNFVLSQLAACSNSHKRRDYISRCEIGSQPRAQSRIPLTIYQRKQPGRCPSLDFQGGSCS
jgi:hypothetical protein